MLIGGQWVDAISGKTSLSVNRYNQQPWAVVRDFEDSDLNAAVNGAISGILRPGMRHTNVQRAPRVAAKVRAGTVWTNAYRIVASGVCAAERA